MLNSGNPTLGVKAVPQGMLIARSKAVKGDFLSMEDFINVILFIFCFGSALAFLRFCSNLK